MKLPRNLKKQKPTSSRAVVALSAKMMRHTLIDFARNLFGNDLAWGNLQQNVDAAKRLAIRFDHQESPSRSAQTSEARLCLLEEVEKLGEFETGGIRSPLSLKDCRKTRSPHSSGVSQGKVSKTWMSVKATLANRIQHSTLGNGRTRVSHLDCAGLGAISNGKPRSLALRIRDPVSRESPWPNP